MAKSFLEQAKVSGIVTCVPRLEKSIDDEIHLFGGNAKQIARLKQTIGLDKRRVVTGGTTAADLCEAAARHLIRSADIPETQIDAIICVTQTPDHSQPCNAAILHGRLDLSKACAAFDVGLGCSGYVYGLWLAHMMVANGCCQRVLLLAGDTLSRLVHPEDRTVAPLFGDGGSATLVERAASEQGAWFSLGTDGKGAQHLIVPAGGARMPASEKTKIPRRDEDGNLRCDENLMMNGGEVFNFSIQVEPTAIRELLEFAGMESNAVDHFVFHQANRYILGNIAKRLKLDPGKVPMQTVERYGNQSSASIPCAMCGELGELLRGEKSRNLVLSGFGVGLSWASALVSMQQLSVCEIIEF